MTSFAEARTEARAFLAALSEGCLTLWHSMPLEWKPATSLGDPQSTTSTRLKKLLDAGAVERQRHGKEVLYRPRNSFSVCLTVSRGGA